MNYGLIVRSIAVYIPLRQLLVRQIFFNHEVVDDKVLTLHSILAHIVFQEFRHLIGLVECNLLKAHVRTYEMHKLLRTNLSQSLESCYLRVWTKVFDSLLTFLVAIAIAGNEFALLRSSYSLLYSLLVLYLGFLIAHTEQRSLQQVQSTLLKLLI